VDIGTLGVGKREEVTQVVLGEKFLPSTCMEFFQAIVLIFIVIL
jgi:hypothetical protein